MQDKRELQWDFSAIKHRLKPNNLNSEMIVRAARLKNFEGTPTLIDATAGLGEDGFILAAYGFNVMLYEYNQVIYGILKEALDHAKDDPELEEIIRRMKLFNEDSMKALPTLAGKADVVYLDPMFPKRKKSGLIKKKFQVLQELEFPCPDEEGLLLAALSAKPKKVVIKRPLKAPALAGRKPDYSIKGSVIRYDCITNL